MVCRGSVILTRDRLDHFHPLATTITTVDPAGPTGPLAGSSYSADLKVRDATLSVLLLALLTPLTAIQVTTPTSLSKAWGPSSGTVILLGGGLADDSAKALEDRLIALAGGPDALIVVIPTAWNFLPAQLPTSGPQPSQIESLRRQLEARGARRIGFLHTRDRQAANSEEFVKALRSAKALFFPGGTPSLLGSTYRAVPSARRVKAGLDIKDGSSLLESRMSIATDNCPFRIAWQFLV